MIILDRVIRVAGIDEVGRGSLFGPVVAAAVMISPEVERQLQDLGVRDSKTLSHRKRQTLLGVIKDLALDCQLGVASVAEIDRFNILQASLLAMKRAVLKLAEVPGVCLVDGCHEIPQLDRVQRTVVKGDRTEVAIAAASIVAKVWRDELITRLDPLFPHYDLRANKGYGTKKHRLAIAQFGPSCLHRRSFKLKSFQAQ
ncbi:MAG: ribonuclease HII [Roseofilum sp. Guam]|nr:ribonuclease HII [Roseofilum sp. Guam]